MPIRIYIYIVQYYPRYTHIRLWDYHRVDTFRSSQRPAWVIYKTFRVTSLIRVRPISTSGAAMGAVVDAVYVESELRSHEKKAVRLR